MLKLLKKNTLFLSLALALIAFCAMGGKALAIDIEVSFKDGVATNNVNIIGDTAGSAGWTLRSGLLGGTKDGGDLYWAARGINNTNGNFRRIRWRWAAGILEFQSNGAGNTQGEGTFVLIDFAGAEVTDLFLVQIGHFDDMPIPYRVLVRDKATAKWYATDEQNLPGGATLATGAIWSEVTNADAIGMNVAAPGTPTFTADLFTYGPTTALPAGIDVDRGGIYVNQNLPLSGSIDPRIHVINFKGPIVNPKTVPDVFGMTQAEATQAFLDAGFSGVPTFSTPADKTNNYFPLGTVFTISDAPGSTVAAADVVAYELVGGVAPYWKFTKGADGNSDVAGNWTASGDLAFGGAALTPPAGSANETVAFDVPQTITIPAGTTFLHGNGFSGGNVTVILEGTLDGGTHKVGAQETFFGSSNPNQATMIIQGAGTFRNQHMWIGTASAWTLSEGSVTVKDTGTLRPDRNLFIGNANEGAGPSTASLTLIGSAITVEVPRDLRLRPNATLKFVADANGFATISYATRGNSNDNLALSDGTIVIDATAFTAATKPSTYTLLAANGVSGEGATLINTDVLANAVITPPTGGDAVEWSLEMFDSDGDGDKDALGLIFKEVLPAEMVVSSTDLVMNSISLPKNETLSNATVTVTNGGEKSFDITGISVTGDLGFALVSPSTTTLPITVGAEDSVPIEVKFDTALLSNPSTAGSYTGTLTVTSDAPSGSPASISLSINVLAGLRPAAIKEEHWILY